MSDFDDALKAVAKARGMTLEDLKEELLAKALDGSDPPPRRGRSTALATSSGDASGAGLSRSEARLAHHSREFPGSPVVRYSGDDESPEEAQERWYASEQELPDGVHGLGGQTAGGIFGDGAIATSLHDPAALGRTDGRVGQQANVRMLGLLERLERRMDAAEARDALPPGARGGALPGAASRRLGRGKP